MSVQENTPKHNFLSIDCADYLSQNPKQSFSGLELWIWLQKNKKDIHPENIVAWKKEKEIIDIRETIQRSEIDQIQYVYLQDPEGRKILLHSGAHLLAQALCLLKKNVKLGVGPALEETFYHDFQTETVSQEDFQALETKMKELVKKRIPIQKETISTKEALSLLAHQPFTSEIIQDLEKQGLTQVSVYRQEEFFNLCRGPHVVHTGQIGTAFSLLNVSACHWKGDQNGIPLQRIYGTVFPSKEELEAYKKQKEEALKRDHRRLGQELSLFHIDSHYAPGDIFWHPNGWTIYCLLQNWIKKMMIKKGYQFVKTPQLVHSNLWKESGHWDKFSHHIVSSTIEEETYGLKPMNCPCHVQIFNHKNLSYKDLPLRLAEFGSCTRFEPSGALMGLMRARCFVQDDAHIFCSTDQIQQEAKNFCAFLLEVYEKLGFTSIEVRLATRPELRHGHDALWDQAESQLKESLHSLSIPFIISEGEGAFYGPKIEFQLKDTLKRSWQCGTLQLDFVLPERLKALYTNHIGQKVHAVMLHRAILGSMERFLGILIEHFAGSFPAWLAPVQIAVITVNDDPSVTEYAKTITQLYQEKNLRAEYKELNETMNKKIRLCSQKKIPFTLVVGQKEKDNQTINMRILGQTEGKELSLKESFDFFTQACQEP